MFRWTVQRELEAWQALGERLAEATRAEGFGCAHQAAVPVHAHPFDELVAHLCPDCDAQLPADWAPSRLPARSPRPQALLEDAPFLRGPEIGWRQGGTARAGSPYLLEAGERVTRPGR
ncbi:hypothetical protein ACFV6B_12680 [Streptomyces microflavus]|uniref:hypothetical protein n=1 Tax=Streptomyces microflavus TaxID=1919 RepID=UPI003661CF05